MAGRPRARQRRCRARPAASHRRARERRHVERAAAPDRDLLRRRDRAQPRSRRRRRGRAPGQARLLQGVRLRRQGARRGGDDRHDLPAGVDDQADGRRRRAGADRAGAPAAARQARRLLPGVRDHAGRRARGRRQVHARGAEAADPDPRPVPPHLGHHLRRSPRCRQPDRGPVAERRRGLVHGQRGRDDRGADQAAARLPARHGLRVRPVVRRPRRRRREDHRQDARRPPRRHDLEAAEDERHDVHG